MLTTRPLLPVYDRKALSYPSDGDADEATYASLADILTDDAEHDAHFSAYSAQACPYRLNKGILSILEDEHLDAGVPMVLFVFDVDDPIAHASGTPARAEWLAAEAYKITSLLMKHEAYVYVTRGGYRVVAGWLPDPFVITSPADAAFWTALYKTHVNALKRRFGIEADLRCADWQRQFRIPRACRDGVVQDLPTYGDPTAIGEWSDEHLIDADVVEPEDVRESKPRPGMRTDPSPGARYLLAMKHAETLPPAVQGAGAENALWAACNEILVGFDLTVESALEIIDASYLPHCDVTKLGPEHFLERARKKLEELNEGAEKPYGYLLDARKMRNAPAFKNLPPATPSLHKEKMSCAPLKEEKRDGVDRAIDRIERQPIGALLRAAFDPKAVRLSTPFPTLNKITGGGFRRKDLVVIVGKPNAGKTSFCVQLGAHFLEHDVPVCILAADESIEFLLGRLAQRKGISRDDIETGTPHAITKIEEICATWKLLPLSNDWIGATLENAAAALHEQWGPGVLIIDSAQTARTDSSEGAETSKARVDDVIKTMKQICERFGHVVLCTSEASRGSYASKNTQEHTEDIAAGKETGNLEYAAKMQLMLRDAKEEDQFTVATAKNKIGRGHPTWRLAWDHVRATFREVEQTTAEDDAKTQVHEFEKAGVAIVSHVKDCSKAGKKFSSKTQIWTSMGQLGKPMQRTLFWNVMAWLESESKISKASGHYEVL